MSISAVNGLELRHLYAFLAVAEHCSFGKAALQLGYTQGAVSQQIGALERVLGLEVFHRPGGPRPVELTEAGRILHGHAEAIVARLHCAADDLAGLRAGTRGRLAVGAFQSVSVRLLPRVAQRLAAERPDLELELFEHDDANELIARLDRRALDAVFLVGNLVDHTYAQTTLLVDPYVAVLPAGEHRPGTPVAMSRLAGEPMIGQPDNDMCQLRSSAGFRAHGYEPRVVFRSADNSTVQAMVRAGRGVAVLPRLAVDLHDPGVVVASIDPPIPPRTIVLIWREQSGAAAAVERFVELAREVASELTSELEAPATAVA
jgi:DNA-binding transcriptional LysR family regulator